MISFEIVIKSMTSRLSEINFTPTFHFENKIYDDMTTKKIPTTISCSFSIMKLNLPQLVSLNKSKYGSNCFDPEFSLCNYFFSSFRELLIFLGSVIYKVPNQSSSSGGDGGIPNSSTVNSSGGNPSSSGSIAGCTRRSSSVTGGGT